MKEKGYSHKLSRQPTKETSKENRKTIPPIIKHMKLLVQHDDWNSSISP